MAKISTNAEINSVRIKEQASAPDTPASGYGQLYEKNDGKLYFKNDAGTEVCLSDILANPMTTAGDIIIGGVSGAPARLAAGTEDYVLTMGATNPEWAVASAGAVDIGARAYNDAAISIPNDTDTYLTFNSESYDTDTIHDASTNTGRLTCKTAGKYLIMANIAFYPDNDGIRVIQIRLNRTTTIARVQSLPVTGFNSMQIVSTIYPLSVNDYVEVMVYHNGGAALDIEAFSRYSPDFMMQKIG